MSKILIINAGSSSLKYQLIDIENEEVLAKGNAERIGIPNSCLKHTTAEKEPVELQTEFSNHEDAIKMVIETLLNEKYGVIKDMSEISAVGHRVVHGGEKFSKSVLIDDEVMAAIKENIELAPLHNPANIMGIEACRNLMPSTPMVAVFDTAFHQTMPRKAFLYAVPYETYEKYGVRRYGFHGTSHKYVALRAAQLLGKPIEELKIITCHLGNGSSLAAVNGGNVLDTSMGLTPLMGLVMGTRCGDMDPAVMPFLMKKTGKTADEMDDIFNKKSGLLGVSGISSDMRDIEVARDSGNKNAKEAYAMFIHRLTHYIGGYYLLLGGADAIVFTGGIGENGITTREIIAKKLAVLGVTFDAEANKSRGEQIVFSKEDSTIKLVVTPTNEELMIAMETVKLTSK